MSKHASDLHIVAFPFQAWGHTRPLVNLATRLVGLKPCTVTLLVTDNYLEQAQAEVGRDSASDEREYERHIRVASLGKADLQDSDHLNRSFEHAWRALVSAEELICQKTNTRYVAAPRPRAIIIDLFGVQAFDVIKAQSGDNVKIYVFNAGLTAALFHLFGPESYGGLDDVRKKAEEEACRTGESMSDIILRTMATPKGEIVRVPGMPPMYDHEYAPQPNGVPPQVIVGMFSRVHGLLEGCDGVLLYTTESYEPVAVKAMCDWFSEASRGVYVCGPLVPNGRQTAGNQTSPTADSAVATETFLNKTLESSGKRSLLYISFGSMPRNAKVDKLWTFLEVVMDLNIPFIMSHSSDDMPPDVQERITSYTKGLILFWTSQQTILQHPATGWFLTHGGHNSVLESTIAGVPMIFWPFGADQPLCAVHVTDNLQAGYELIECREGAEGMKPIYRSGKAAQGTAQAFKAEALDILRKAFGNLKDGEQKRGNLHRFTETMKREWDDGGSSRRDVLGFLEDL
ncbi:UDP-Glycosyltransferase/glycogen phosphorylase [Cubamyces sp. BRFM 1775]|nr:UDP-Glycosyltransferase/glycogen phosphorylase [Cubamyces sp. BRFM 1775]